MKSLLLLLVVAASVRFQEKPIVSKGTLTLEGRHDQMVSRDVVEINSDERIRLTAKWTDHYGQSYEMDVEMAPSAWKALCDKVVSIDAQGDYNSYVSHGIDWKFQLATDGFRREFSARTSQGDDAPQAKVIHAVLAARNRFLHAARKAAPAQVREGSMRARPPVGEGDSLLIDELAQGYAPVLLDKDVAFAKILIAGRHPNREIVDALVKVLDGASEENAGAACAVLSWMSGKPASADRKAWKEWWLKTRETWKPAVREHSTGAVGGGVVRSLGRFASGLEWIDLDKGGAVWGAVGRRVEYLDNRFECFKLDAAQDRWAKTPQVARLHSHDHGRNDDLRFLRLFASSPQSAGIHHFHWCAASKDERFGVAIVGPEDNAYLHKELLVFDFEKGTAVREHRTSNQFAVPKLSADGRYVALSEGWNWANPNWVTIYDRQEKNVIKPEIPRAGNLDPLGFAGGAAYFARCTEEPKYDRFEIWSFDLASGKSKLVWKAGEETYHVFFSRTILVDRGGPLLLVTRRQEEGAELGFLDFEKDKFTPVSLPSSELGDFAVDRDGNRVVFLSQSQAFEWTRSK